MSSPSWDDVRGEFEFDGSWKDIYVLGTDLAGWQRMLDGLRAAGYDLSYSRGGQPSDLPAEAEHAFPLEGECDRLLSVRFSGVRANCHFFTPDEIEFDIDPREVAGQEQLDAAFGFMSCLAESVGREAVLCFENGPGAPVFRVRPGSPAVEHLSAGGSSG